MSKKEMRHIENLILEEETKKVEIAEMETVETEAAETETAETEAVETETVEVLSQEKSRKWIPCAIGAIIAVIFLIAIIVVVMNGNKKETTQTETASEVTTTIQETEVETTKESSKQETEETVVKETENEAEAEVSLMEERLTSLGMQGIYVAVWNDNDATEHVIKEAEVYEHKEGDRYFICTPSIIRSMDTFTTVKYTPGAPTENYFEILFDDFKEENAVELEIFCKNGEEGKINFVIMFPSEEKGYEWVQALGYDNPKMVVYNDETGLRKELEEGEEYQLSNGDQVAMYTPEDYVFNDSNAKEENVVRTVNVAIVKLENLDLGEKFDLEISAMQIETYDIVTLHVTLLPPTK